MHNNHQDLTLEEAEHRRQVRATQVHPIPPGEKPKTDNLDAALQRMLERVKVMTPEEEQAHRAECALLAAEDKARRAQRLLAASYLPLRHANHKALRVNAAWAKALESIAAQRKQGFLIALIGRHGTGKTQLAVELVRGYCHDGLTCAYATALTFFLRIKECWQPDSKQSEADVIDRYCERDFLVIDEFEKRSATEWEARLLFEVLNRRYNSMRDTLIISNQSEEEILEMLGPALTSRLRETGEIIKCEWGSFRHQA